MRITALNGMVSKHVSQNLMVIPVGPNKVFIKGDWSDIEGAKHLEIRRGYFTSVTPGASRPLLNVNVATSAFYKPLNLAGFFAVCESCGEDAKSHLKGLNVYIGYQRKDFKHGYDPNHPDNRRRVVAGFGEPPKVQDFTLDNGQATTVFEYFKSLGHEAQHERLPCVIVNIAPQKLDNYKIDFGKARRASGKKPTPDQENDKFKIHWILPELLYIDPYQPYGTLLPTDFTEKMIESAVRLPSVNQNLILTEGFPLLGITNGAIASSGIAVGKELLLVPASQMQHPRIVYRSPDASSQARTEATLDNSVACNLKNGERFFSPPPEQF